MKNTASTEQRLNARFNHLAWFLLTLFIPSISFAQEEISNQLSSEVYQSTFRDFKSAASSNTLADWQSVNTSVNEGDGHGMHKTHQSHDHGTEHATMKHAPEVPKQDEPPMNHDNMHGTQHQMPDSEHNNHGSTHTEHSQHQHNPAKGGEHAH